MSNTGLESRHTILRFDKFVFSLPAVKKAAYKFLNAFTADINLDQDEIICTLTFTPPLNEELTSRLIEDFKKEVLDQDLREQIRSETEPIRKLIFALAFSKTGIARDGQVPSD